MASILDRYGIKEVADVMFYEINEQTGAPSNPVLYFNTLKVSTIETTSENTSARGGKGNPELIAWDYNKEITVTLEDALFSAKSMAIMFANGKSTDVKTSSSVVHKTITYTAVSTSPTVVPFEKPDGTITNISVANGTFYNQATGTSVLSTALTENSTYYFTCNMPVAESQTIEISAKKFPGTYYIEGDTYARSDTTGLDEFFQFVIPKAKVLGENTLTMEAEGDPSTFSMNLKVLRPADGVMMKLIKYSVA